MRQSSLLITLVTGFAIILAAALGVPLLQSARGSYSAKVRLTFEKPPSEFKPHRYTFALNREVESMIQHPIAPDIDWQTIEEFGIPTEQRVRGGFSADWTLYGYQRINHPYAETAVIEDRDDAGRVSFRSLSIPWDPTKSFAEMVIPAPEKPSSD